MKYVLLALLFVASLRAEPEELFFLRKLLPKSEHQSTQVIRAVPLGYIVAHWIGDDTFDTAISRLSGELKTDFVEVKPVKEKDAYLAALLQLHQKADSAYMRAIGDDIRVDIISFESRFEGVIRRHIYMKIERKGA